MPKGEIVFRNGDHYDGELTQDQPNGRGIYKFKNGSYYDGEFSSGKFHGRGKLVDTFAEVTIVGEFAEGSAEGRCKVQYGDGSTYEGQMRAGLRTGKGTLNFGGSCSEQVYKGWFSHDEFQGQGELLFKNGDVYRGKFEGGALQGQSQIITQTFSFVGQVRSGAMEGRGSIKYSSGDLYEGEFAMNQKHGTGKYTYSCGDLYQGTWINDRRRGRGRLTLKSGDAFEGQFDEDFAEGSGTWADWRVEGQIKEGRFDGMVRIKQNGADIEANFAHGVQDGLVKMSKSVKGQNITYRGQFQKGRQKPYSVQYSKRI